ncbi:MAG: helix-turn-helix domain-containing protein [bacterium]|jgi:hypothetical protein
MENWQVEIKRLDKMRLELGLNMNQLEKITGIDRGQLKRFFEFTNVPSMKFYFDVKVALENEFEVKFKDIEPIVKNQYNKLCENYGVDKTQNTNSSTFENNSQCDCKLENGLLKRGKIKCTLSKAEHKF